MHRSSVDVDGDHSSLLICSAIVFGRSVVSIVSVAAGNHHLHDRRHPVAEQMKHSGDQVLEY